MEKLGLLPIPTIVDLSEHIDRARLGIAESVSFYGLLGGDNPSGSLKDVGVSSVLRHALGLGIWSPPAPIAEVSNGSMARSLAWAARTWGVDSYVAYPGSSPESVARIGGSTELQYLDVPASSEGHDHPLVRYFHDFEAECQKRSFYFLDQTRNHMFRLGYEEMVPGVLRQLQELHGAAEVNCIVGAVGTGSSLGGIVAGMEKKMSRTVHSVGVEPVKSHGTNLPWHDIPGLRNTEAFHWLQFSEVDTYDAQLIKERIEVTLCRAQERTDLLCRGGIRAGLSSGAALEGFVKNAQSAQSATYLLILCDASLA